MDKSAGANAKQAIAGLSSLVVLLWAVLFLPAWSLDYWQAWLYWSVFSLSVSAISIYFLRSDPALVESRLKAGLAAEEGKLQNAIQALLGALFILLFVLSSLGHRFKWSGVPAFFAVAGDAFAAVGLLVIFLVFRENSYTSGIIEVSKGQEAVSTGPYRVVRHPTYSGALLMLSFTPIALGSLWGLVAVLPMFVVLAARLLDEEKFLLKNLHGYGEYCEKTRYRLVPLCGRRLVPTSRPWRWPAPASRALGCPARPLGR